MVMNGKISEIEQKERKRNKTDVEKVSYRLKNEATVHAWIVFI